MQSKAATVKEYLASLPADRREAVEAVRKTILKNLNTGYEEGMQYGMIGYFVPHSVYPKGYHCDPEQPLPFAALASQKNNLAVYLMSVAWDAEQERWFRSAWARTGKKLDMGKSCVRFRKLEDCALDVVGEAIRRVTAKEYIARYEQLRESSLSARSTKPAKSKPGAMNTVAKHTTARKSASTSAKSRTTRSRAKSSK